ncbi:hypothetical protein KIN20_009758, partial [Parelaphostrongylus tenuis]
AEVCEKILRITDSGGILSMEGQSRFNLFFPRDRDDNLMDNVSHTVDVCRCPDRFFQGEANQANQLRNEVQDYLDEERH